jgi:1-phosphofructokinase
MIATVTLNPAVDHTIHLDEPLDGGAIHRATAFSFDAGGKGINVSKYCAGLGVETLATGISGAFPGEYLTDRLDSDEVAHEFVTIDGRIRLNTTVLAEVEYKINHPGPTLDSGTIDTIIEVLLAHDPETVVVAGSLPPGLDARAVDRIANAGEWETAVDVGGRMLPELETDYVLCKPNGEELAAATGVPTDSIESAIEAARTLRERGFERVVASLGSKGAVSVSDAGAHHAAALDAEVRDTVGAGDSLLAGVLAARTRGADDRGALALGLAVAARVVGTPGTTVPDLDGIETDADQVSITRL